VLVSVAILCIASRAHAQGATTAPRVERAVIPGGAGPNRLTVDVPLLAGAAPFNVEGKDDPHARAGLINGLTNPAKCRLAINERVDTIAAADRIGAGGDKWDMSHMLCGCAHHAGEPHMWTHR